MQALFYQDTSPAQNQCYNSGMRKTVKPRSKQGQRLTEFRVQAGLSQYELARLIGEPQSNVAFWEQSEKPPRSEVLPILAKVLGVRVEELLNVNGHRIPGEKKSGPVGRVHQVFEEVSRLPRRQQEKVIEFVSAFVKQYSGEHR